MTISKKNVLPLAIAGGVTLALLAPILIANITQAATLTRVLVRFDRMKTSEFTSGLVCVNPTTVGTEARVQVDFPTGYTVSTTVGNWTVSTATTTGWPATAVAWPGIATATAATGQTVTFPSSDLTPGTLYCFNWTNTVAALQVKASATSSNTGTVTTQTSAPATIDTGGYSTASIANDQIVVTATVPQTFSFALSGNTDPLGTLTSGSVTTSGTPRTATVNTNAKNGWLVWARSANTGLNSSSASYTIPATTAGSNTTLNGTVEGFNFGVTGSQSSGSGTLSVAAGYDGTAAGQGGGLDTTLRTLASSNGTASNAVLTLKNNVAIIGTTPAATDYTDTITVVGAGLF